MKTDILTLICKIGARVTQRLGVGIPFSIKINEVKFSWRTYSIIEWLLWIRGWENLLELRTRKFFVKNIRNYDVFLDIGANTGIYSILASGLSDKIKAIAIEPVFSNCVAISKIREINNFSNLYILNSGLTDKINFSKFFTPGNQHYPCSGTLSKPLYKKASKPNYFLAFSGDIFESLISNQRVLIKIDVEGHEEFVLKGLSKFLRSNQCTIIIEILPESDELYQFYVDFFRSYSMSPFRISEDGEPIPMGNSTPSFSSFDGINFSVNVLFLHS